MKCSLGISNILEDISRLSSIVIVFLYFCTDLLERLSHLSLLFFGALHSNGYIFPFLFCFSFLFFSQLFIRPPQTTILPFLHFCFLGMVLITAFCKCYEHLPIVLHALILSNLVLRICLSLPLYNCKLFDLGHTWMVVVFPTFFKSEFCNMSSWATVSSSSCFYLTV